MIKNTFKITFKAHIFEKQKCIWFNIYAGYKKQLKSPLKLFLSFIIVS